MRYEIKSIGVWAYIKIGFFLNLLIGFVAGVFFAVFMSLQIAMMDQFGIGAGAGMAVDDLPMGMMLILMPILFAIGGAVFYTLMGLIFVLIYNLVAKVTGGFEMDLRAVEQTVPVQPAVTSTTTPQWQPPPPPSSTPPPPPPSSAPPPVDNYRSPGPQEPPAQPGDEPM